MNESEIKYWKIRHLVRVNNKSFFRDCLLLYTFIQHVHCTMKRLTSCIWSSSSTMPNRYKVDTWNIQHKHLYNMNRVPKSKSPLSTMEWSVERIRDLEKLKKNKPSKEWRKEKEINIKQGNWNWAKPKLQTMAINTWMLWTKYTDRWQTRDDLQHLEYTQIKPYLEHCWQNCCSYPPAMHLKAL